MHPRYLLGLIAVCLSGTGYPAYAEDTSAQQLEYFEKHVRPLLIEHCYECHSGSERDGGLQLDSQAAWQAGGDSGPAIVPGSPADSRLMEAVGYQNLELQMPPSGQLPDDRIAILEKWIRDGAVDPRNQSASAAKASGMSIAEGRQFWSMQPLSDPAIPSTMNDPWVTTPIDAFILAQLQASDIRPAPPADRRTLIRRVTYDLIGLPPTPAAIANFLEDDSPQAYERLVERLLESPRYGERWGRHWLDVARYADSNGLDENLAFGNAWRYRDYVIAAFNSDKPFDQFLIEQLAGDLLPYANTETRTATGFLSLGAKVLAEPDREKLTMDTVDEQIDAVGKAFLGMTLGCVRCHDHKFDPIQQRDYYALAAIFKSTRTFADSNTGAIKHWFEHSLATDAEVESLKTIDAEIAAKNSAATQFKNKAVTALREQAVAKAASYLAAASRVKPTDSFAKVQQAAQEYDLHARMLHHCRLHLAYNAEDPFFSKWHELVARGASEEHIESYFGELFTLASSANKTTTEKPAPEEAATEATADDTAAATEAEQPVNNATNPEFLGEPYSDELIALAKQALLDHAGFLTVPPQPEHAFDDATLQEYYRLMEEARLLESAAPDQAAAMGVSDANVLVSLPIHIRGSHHNLGEPVQREFPQVMRYTQTRPVFPRNRSGRLELAQWMASSQHPLTARVYVNRIWRWHFGEGLVKSTDNFGALGERPSHPELLDWLAHTFIELGWSTKELHRLIVTSSTYQMSATHPDEATAVQADPENRWLWKARIQRLEAEQIRDAVLATADRLELTQGGKTVPLRNRQFVFNHTSVDHTQYDSLRRAIYLPVIRNNLYTLFEQFDFPDPTMPTGSRNSTVVAPQALLMMNDELILDCAAALAVRVANVSERQSERIEFAYQVTLGRLPNSTEIDRATEFLANDDTRLSLFCHSLLACNEFIYLR
ncbi:MAG: PSD1 and planctomycete cytochrome C domain-containing protein [Pirellulaceae bacterium]